LLRLFKSLVLSRDNVVENQIRVSDSVYNLAQVYISENKIKNQSLVSEFDSNSTKARLIFYMGRLLFKNLIQYGM